MLVRITGRAEVTHEGGGSVTASSVVRELDGAESEDACANHLDSDLADIGITGGMVKLTYDSGSGLFRVSSEYTVPAKLKPALLKRLARDTVGQWSDGIGEGCFDSVMEKREVFIDLSPGGKATATQADDGTPAPKKSPAKVAAGALAKAAADGDLGTVKELVAGKAKLETRDRNGWTPLVAAIANDHLAVALYLIEHGASPTALTRAKGTR